MLSTFTPLEYLLIVFAGWVHRQQLDVIDYLQEENRVALHRCAAPAPSGEGQTVGAQGPERHRLDRHAGYADGLADGDEVGSFRQTRARASAHSVRHCRTDRSHGRRESFLGLYADPGRALANLGHRVARGITPSTVVWLPQGPVRRRERLGGMLSYYQREAA
jgi:hypothetical protein